MSWNFLDVLEGVFDVLELFSSGSGSKSSSERKSLNYDERVQSKVVVRSKYYTEKISAGFILAAIVLFIIIFKNPLRAENYVQTLIVASLIGIAISFVVFFVLHVFECFYFKNIFKLLLFSCSVIAFFISFVLCIYFKSGIFI
ncbi:branched-chain amino acid ABC transporter substrate-binding protein [Chryseobacterium lactis]|uniref:Branched-chain amino acid ABC transporter substrate-binding protein n=1 Tax=Chryseobacterium lactis TaxID=1241981 RepID=A0A3G6RDR0_CHRLC|nr:branched-chain amino acid ABC transporter substrate-binding protein [Chryseobacterium lactis]AZB03221.1 branched-chain amino acid ABC transporter substrate-binding protein [Chryseobacterium lactis]PNW11290.1 branched-chain amino acid ABC transporter substrate-binding protein [Chryseobacterium lactis]